MSILRNICDELNIPVKNCTEDMDNAGPGNAFAYNVRTPEGKNEYSIFIDKDADLWEKRLQVAHELGHVILGHVKTGCVLKHDEMEQEARIFAGSFIALLMFKEYGGI